MFEVELLTEAEKELANAYDWYEEQLTSLGNRFYKEIKYYLTLIENNPYLFQIRYSEELRAASLNKFPFLIIYWIDEINRVVYVTSIFHTSRSPKYF
ncbi:type II toxin-antitoxin system RelE/ParE family toxin [Mucilaginibacter sp. BJC16-A38]|uniref:type II toxin-antitoxin system RelE/ParE family toxin n=1 Tax=Mucilaginibacter phenanthrenivorans TaxID=1234842 RepID=UPI00358E51C8|nr:type II toxin-antitoxin system RelE/ParE family toxin [Mucilaginibacter phenanthrenivorans]